MKATNHWYEAAILFLKQTTCVPQDEVCFVYLGRRNITKTDLGSSGVVNQSEALASCLFLFHVCWCIIMSSAYSCGCWRYGPDWTCSWGVNSMIRCHISKKTPLTMSNHIPIYHIYCEFYSQWLTDDIQYTQCLCPWSRVSYGLPKPV